MATLWSGTVYASGHLASSHEDVVVPSVGDGKRAQDIYRTGPRREQDLGSGLAGAAEDGWMNSHPLSSPRWLPLESEDCC